MRNIANGALGGTPEKMVHSEEVQERRSESHLTNSAKGSCQGVVPAQSTSQRFRRWPLEEEHQNQLSTVICSLGPEQGLALQDGPIPTSSPEAPAHPEPGCLRTRVRLRGLSWFDLYTRHSHFQGQKLGLGCAKHSGRARVKTGRCE